MSGIDIDHLRGWIGTEQIIGDLATEDFARKYHATFDLPGEPPRPGEPLPRLIHFCLAQPAGPTAALGTDGHPARGGFLPPVPLPRRMWAGGALTFHGDLRVGDAVRRISRVEDVVLKEGRSGPLCFVTVFHRIAVGDRTVVEERQDIVYRDAGVQGTAKAQQASAGTGEHSRPMVARPPLLFRYSALTFNSHRIHYDRDYAMQDEGYPGLVVHGPLQAALLINYAGELHGAGPRRFSYRGMSPLFDGMPFTLNASRDGEGLKLWTATGDGVPCMGAEASWV